MIEPKGRVSKRRGQIGSRKRQTTLITVFPQGLQRIKVFLIGGDRLESRVAQLRCAAVVRAACSARNEYCRQESDSHEVPPIKPPLFNSTDKKSHLLICRNVFRVGLPDLFAKAGYCLLLLLCRILKNTARFWCRSNWNHRVRRGARWGSLSCYPWRLKRRNLDAESISVDHVRDVSIPCVLNKCIIEY